MSPIELFEHQRHLYAAIHELEKRIPIMDEETKRRAYKTLDNLEREHARAVEMAATGIIQ
ncbi:hypothetical protein [Ectopseudomonas composti]|uniref:hypothetical protein n=1 Tax=Ectopseudomonas composti TaxID=658457 RepID=UPI0007741CBC|nr:hypothetical protein [Pseudomonas composti]